MGLRFRKTISILPGVRLNLGKSTASVSVGVPGFRKTFNTKGQVTTTVGVPGTGLYYVDTKNTRKKKESRQNAVEKPRRTAEPAQRRLASPQPSPQWPTPQATPLPSPGARFAAGSSQLTREKLLSIHKTADDTIHWNEVHAAPEPPDASYSREMWEYYHNAAPAVLAGDIDAYLQLIYEVNPLEDLLDYGGEFTFGTDDPALMEVEFIVNEEALLPVKGTFSRAEYHEILQDFVCSTAIRVARDVFALLPVESAVVHAETRNGTALSAAFDRETMSGVRFGFIDPSDVMDKFRHNMNFDPASGFQPVDRLQ